MFQIKQVIICIQTEGEDSHIVLFIIDISHWNNDAYMCLAKASRAPLA